MNEEFVTVFGKMPLSGAYYAPQDFTSYEEAVQYANERFGEGNYDIVYLR